MTNCSDGGVLGVVPGIIGSLQALEAVRLLTPGLGAAHAQSLLLFDGLLGRFRTVKLRGRQPDCAVCGEEPTVTRLVDYVQFCGAAPTDKVRRLSGSLNVAYFELCVDAQRELSGLTWPRRSTSAGSDGRHTSATQLTAPQQQSSTQSSVLNSPQPGRSAAGSHRPPRARAPPVDCRAPGTRPGARSRTAPGGRPMGASRQSTPGVRTVRTF